jgi:hypothetical protein
MKLKRLLLRYEPPGVGLEIDEDGETTVVHKDLPAAQDLPAGGSVPAIRRLVDGIIEEENQLLSKKKHQAALVQLLGRLYQVDVTEDDNTNETAEPAKEKSSARAAPAAPEAEPEGTGCSPIVEGQEVVLVGLKANQQVHNGEVGVIHKAKLDKGKFEVVLRAGDQTPIKIKGVEHLIPTARVNLAVGTPVSIGGLRNHIELNGMFGRIESCHHDTNRYEIRAIESGQLFRVKKENIVPIEPNYLTGADKENLEPQGNMQADAKKGADSPGDDLGCKPGHKVMLHGLRTAMCYNGQVAVVLSVDKARGRYEIKLNDGSVKTVRAENVKNA